MKQKKMQSKTIRAAATALLAIALAGPRLLAAQTSAPQQTAPPQLPPKPAESNPFPDDTKTIPVLPVNGDAADLPAEAPSDASASLFLPTADLDPVRSPDGDADEPVGDTHTFDQGFSSSRSGLDSILSGDESTSSEKKGRRKGRPEPPPHVETAAEDLSIAKYYLERKDWKAALSRYQSALVLAPEEPDVYWGLAESQRHLGDLPGARTNYQLVVAYDPDSRHGKDAAKLLKSPELANVKATK
jgi:tetratricopeptide (TPR) repeat protein